MHGTGVLRFVEAPGPMTHLLLAVDKGTVALVGMNEPGVEIAPIRAMGAWGLCEVRLTSAALTLLPWMAVALGDVGRAAGLALTARAYGAARRAFDLAVDYAKERHHSSGSRSGNSRRSSTSSQTASSRLKVSDSF